MFFPLEMNCRSLKMNREDSWPFSTYPASLLSSAMLGGGGCTGGVPQKSCSDAQSLKRLPCALGFGGGERTQETPSLLPPPLKLNQGLFDREKPKAAKSMITPTCPSLREAWNARVHRGAS